MKIIFFLRKYKYEIITFVVAIISYFINFLQYSGNELTVLIISVVMTVIFTFIIIIVKIRDKNLHYLSLQNRKDKDNWIGSGIFEYERSQDCYKLKDADPGYIYSQCLNWSDYKIKFSFKIIKTSIGVNLRAVNLSNLVMLQIFNNGIKPHIRINGMWNWWEPEDANLIIESNLNLDKWHQCIIECEKKGIHIKLFDKKKEIFNRSWDIPSGTMNFEYKRPEVSAPEAIIPFAIDLDYGSFGFRNWGDEEAFVKDVSIEKIIN